MKINYSNEEVIIDSNSIFLAGPAPRDKNIVSWRNDAIDILKELRFDGVVYNPEYKDVPKDNDSKDENCLWERKAMNCAKVILFWIPRNNTDMLGLTTNVEFGYFIHTGKILYGRPDNSYMNKYLDWLYRYECNKEPYNDLKELIKEALIKLKNEIY